MVKKKQVLNNKLQHFKNAYVHGGRRELCVQKITKSRRKMHVYECLEQQHTCSISLFVVNWTAEDD